MTIGNQVYKFIEFNFIEFCGVYPAMRGPGSKFALAPKE